MIVCYFYFSCLVVGPFKANAPLVIDADAILPGTVALELLESVPRDHLQILQRIGIIQVQQFAAGRALDIRGKFSGELTPEDLFGLLGCKGFDHSGIISSGDNIVKMRRANGVRPRAPPKGAVLGSANCR